MNSPRYHAAGRWARGWAGGWGRRGRWAGLVAVSLLGLLPLGAMPADDPIPPVPFTGTISIFDHTSPPETSWSFGLAAYSLSRSIPIRSQILDPPLVLDQQFHGQLCWDDYCGTYLDPPPFGSVEFSSSLSASGTYLCNGPILCSTSFRFYFIGTDIVACPNDGCVIPVEINFRSRFGTVKGSVTLRDGTPAIAKTVLAKDPEGVLKSVSTETDAYGKYDFTARFAPVEPDHPAYGKVYPPIPLDPDNNWGLTVYGDGGFGNHPKEYYSNSQGKKDWLIGIPPVGHQQTVTVRGGDVSYANFVILLPGEEDDDPDKQDCFTEGEPVSVMTGNVFFHQVDASMMDLRGPVAFARTYNSQNAYHSLGSGLFGPGWTHAYQSRLSFPTEYRGIILRRPTGVPIYYTDPEGDGTYDVYLPLAERSWLVKSGDTYTRYLYEGGREVYDAEGRLTEQVDVFGAVTALEYDGFGRLTRILMPSGRAFSLSYGSDAVRLLAPEGPVATYRFESGRLDRVDYPDGSGFRYTYDDRGQLIAMSDATGLVLERHTYVDGKAVSSEVGAGQQRYDLEYAPGVTTVTDALGNQSVYEFTQIQEDKVLTKVSGPCSVCGGSGTIREWTYDDKARMTSYTDALGNTTSYTYDAEGNRLTETNPDQETTTFTYDARGRVLTRLDPAGGLTTYTYGPFGLVTATDALDHTTTVEYDARGLTSAVHDARGGRYSFSRDQLGDLTGITDPAGRSVTYEYDEMGRRTLVRDDLGNFGKYSYDSRGRLRKVTRGDGSGVEIRYDAGGRRSSLSTITGGSTTYVYDDAGRLNRVADPLNDVMTLGYDTMSKVTSWSDARGNVTHYRYDAFGQVTEVTFPDGTSETLVYDPAGRLGSRMDRKGTTVSFRYDGAGRLVGKDYSDGTPSVAYAYDEMGRLVRAENADDTLIWTYDLAGRVLSEASARNHSTLEYAYDPSGNRLSLSLDGDVFATYDTDLGSILRSISYGTHVFRFEHDEAYRRTRLIFPNGVATDYDYDAASRVRSISALSGAVSVAAAEYTYDPIGRISSLATPERTESYGYDALDRLTSVDRTGSELRHWSFQLDASGNRTTTDDGENVATSVYNARNQLERREPGGSLLIRGELDEPGTVEVNGQPASLIDGNRFEARVSVPPGTSTIEVAATDGSGNVRTNRYEVDVNGATAGYQYDANGNLVEKAEGATVWTYEWNGENQLERVLKDGDEVVRFAYDPLGRRVEKKTPDATFSYSYDGDRILRETSSLGDVVRYVHGPGIDEPLAADRNGVLSFYHLDARGSVVSMSNEAGAQTSSIRYDAFGKPEGAIPSGYAYTGREWDEETGLYYYRARYYDPESGRFISEDPIGVAGGPNLYQYAGSSPVNFRDPSGTSWVGNLWDSFTETIQGPGEIVRDPSKNLDDLKRQIERRITLSHLYELWKCWSEESDCVREKGKVCRCGSSLSEAQKSYCNFQVAEYCSQQTLPCLGKLLMDIALTEGLSSLVP